MLLHSMADYMCTYEQFSVEYRCQECAVLQEKEYEFMVLNCACGCGDMFKICEVCSPLFIFCDCGCESNYKKCLSRKMEGNISVSVYKRKKYFFSYFLGKKKEKFFFYLVF